MGLRNGLPSGIFLAIKLRYCIVAASIPLIGTRYRMRNKAILAVFFLADTFHPRCPTEKVANFNKSSHIGSDGTAAQTAAFPGPAA
jgi:hypothetical protein